MKLDRLGTHAIWISIALVLFFTIQTWALLAG
jgi:hypothetical protein